jgi:hypothetical protein
MNRLFRNFRAERDIQLASILDHGKPRQVLAEVGRLFRSSFPASAFAEVKEAFALTEQLYAGSFPGYQACSTGYHDFTHVLEVFSASARLLDGRVLAGPKPSAQAAVDLLVAALLHDSGYILESGDKLGTGAKYTKTHVDRSAAFVVRHAPLFHLDPNRADDVARMILGTDLARKWKDLVFSDETEEDCAAILSAADILGQMGDRVYLEKLLFLYFEFREAGFGGYESAYAILEKTLAFYDGVRQRLDVTLAPTQALARLHFAKRFKVDRDLYRESIQRQMDYLARIVADDTTNFRKKLKRMDLEAAERARQAAAN